MKQMQARLQIELMHTFCAISIVRVNYDFIDVLIGKFFFQNSRTTLLQYYFFKWPAEMDGKFQ